MLDGIVYLNQPDFKKVSENFDLAISDLNIPGFKGKFTLDLYFDNDEKPKYLDVVVIKNGNLQNQKTIKAQVSSFPVDVEITGPQLIELFGPIVVGDNFDIGANYTTNDGKTYLAFPPGGGPGYGPGVSAQPGATPTTRYSCICGFDLDNFLGNGTFVVVEDKWADYQPGQEVQIKKLNATQVSMESPDPGFKDYIIDINPKDNSAKMASQTTATDGLFWYGADVGSVTLSTAGSPALSFVNPCNNELQLNIQFLLSKYGNQGAFLIKLKRK